MTFTLSHDDHRKKRSTYKNTSSSLDFTAKRKTSSSSRSYDQEEQKFKNDGWIISTQHPVWKQIPSSHIKNLFTQLPLIALRLHIYTSPFRTLQSIISYWLLPFTKDHLTWRVFPLKAWQKSISKPAIADIGCCGLCVMGYGQPALILQLDHYSLHIHRLGCNFHKGLPALAQINAQCCTSAWPGQYVSLWIGRQQLRKNLFENWLRISIIVGDHSEDHMGILY